MIESYKILLNTARGRYGETKKFFKILKKEKSAKLDLLFSENHIRFSNEINCLDCAKHKPNEMSGGQRQRVAIARALVNDPSILFADEPTGNLDSRTGLAIIALFQKLHREGATIVMVTHEMDIALHASRIIHLKDGKIIGDEKIEHPKDAEMEYREVADLDVDNLTDAISKHE